MPFSALKEVLYDTSIYLCSVWFELMRLVHAGDPVKLTM